jgi:hypothetical protein
VSEQQSQQQQQQIIGCPALLHKRSLCWHPYRLKASGCHLDQPRASASLPFNQLPTVTFEQPSELASSATR